MNLPTARLCQHRARLITAPLWMSLIWVALTAPGGAQTPPTFHAVRLLTNREISLSLSSAPVRIDAATTLQSNAWRPLATFTPGTTSLTYTDTAAPYLPLRFYRAETVAATNLSGDYLNTDDGDVLIRAINHASVVLQWKSKMIYVDAVGGAAPYAGMPKADVILVSHAHGDHFHSGTIDGIRGSNAVILVPQAVFNSLSTAQRAIAGVLTNGATTNVHGLTVEAVPAYNLTTSNHPRGVGNGYVLTVGGRRIFFSGDTEDVPEIRTLPNIDLAFLCMNLPFTMSLEKAISTTRQMRPRVIYPYHYRNSDSTFTDLNEFKRRVGQDLGIEVRFRKWY